MKRLASIVAILLLLLTAAPVMACVADQAQTPAQAECCRQMHGDCGAMATTGCCPSDVREQAAQTAAMALLPVLQATASGAATALVVPAGRGLAARRVAPAQHSPPRPDSAAPSILRI